MRPGGGRPISSINLLITSLVWRQDHNGSPIRTLDSWMW